MRDARAARAGARSAPGMLLRARPVPGPTAAGPHSSPVAFRAVADRGLQWLLSSSFDHFARRTMAHFEGMTDDEYLWEPVPGCWTVRLDTESRLHGG